MASKNQDVEALSIQDIQYPLTRFQIKNKDIIEIEYILRQKCDLELESATLFDFVMYYIKLWKFELQDNFIKKPLRKDLYYWICTIETMAYDISKSLLIDVECQKYSPSIIVCSLITVSILVHQLVVFSQAPIQD